MHRDSAEGVFQSRQSGHIRLRAQARADDQLVAFETLLPSGGDTLEDPALDPLSPPGLDDVDTEPDPSEQVILLRVRVQVIINLPPRDGDQSRSWASLRIRRPRSVTSCFLCGL